MKLIKAPSQKTNVKVDLQDSLYRRWHKIQNVSFFRAEMERAVIDVTNHNCSDFKDMYAGKQISQISLHFEKTWRNYGIVQQLRRAQQSGNKKVFRVRKRWLDVLYKYRLETQIKQVIQKGSLVFVECVGAEMREYDRK